MKLPFTPTPSKLLVYGLIVAAIGLFALLLSSANDPIAAGGPYDGTPSFLPIVQKPWPTPTATAVPAQPQFVENVPLPGAQCPNSVFVNEVTDYVYIANNFSNNISFLRGTEFLGNVPSGGNWPTRMTMIPENGRTFITNLHSLGNMGPPTPLAEFDGMNLLRTYDQLFEGYTPLYNPVNEYLYVSDLDSNIRVFDASTSPMTFVKDINQTDGVQGWIKAITLDPETGLVYAASWDYGEFYVIDGLDVIAVVETQTWGPDQLLVDANRKYLYIVGQEVAARPDGYPANNVAVFNAEAPYEFLGGFATSSSSTRLVQDPLTGFVYVINPKDDSVTMINGLHHIGTIYTGDFPQGIGINPNTGYVFVANTESHTITILKDGAFVQTIPSQGVRPFAVDVNSADNYVYVAHRGTEGHLQCSENASVTILR